MGIYNLGGGGGAPELQAKEATPLITNAQQIILPDEGYDGLSKVTVNPMPTGALKTPTVNSIGYVSSGVQTAGYFDTSATSGLQLSTQAAKTITPTTYSQTAVASGKYTTGNVTVSGDANLVSSNIVAGKSIFGVSGSVAQYYEYSTSACTPSLQYSIDCSFSTNIPNKLRYITMVDVSNSASSSYIYLLTMRVNESVSTLTGKALEKGICYRAGNNDTMYGGYATIIIRSDYTNMIRIYIKTPASGGPVFGADIGTYTCRLYGYV